MCTAAENPIIEFNEVDGDEIHDDEDEMLVHKNKDALPQKVCQPIVHSKTRENFMDLLMSFE